MKHHLLAMLAVSLFAFVLYTPSKSLAQTYTESVLYNFPFSDAGVQQQNVVVDSAGNVYGAESNGGPNYDCDFNEFPCGQIFKISTDGVFSTAYAFTKHSKGAGPSFSGYGQVRKPVRDHVRTRRRQWRT